MFLFLSERRNITFETILWTEGKGEGGREGGLEVLSALSKEEEKGKVGGLCHYVDGKLSEMNSRWSEYW